MQATRAQTSICADSRDRNTVHKTKVAKKGKNVQPTPDHEAALRLKLQFNISSLVLFYGLCFT